MSALGPHAILDNIENTLRYLARSGCTGFDVSPTVLKRMGDWGSGPPVRVASENKQESLGHVQTDLGDCRRCALHRERRHIVFGAGHPSARLVFVGEGPGADEDRQGQPFVGAAGQLLTRIIAAMGLTRGEVYICNVIKCRPPGNRNPQPEEIAACVPFLVRQLQAIAPECICALGKFAAQTLIETQVPISALRGRFFEYHGIPVMPTYHPAFLLRNPSQKRAVWEDVQKIMKRLGLKTPRNSS